MSSSKVVVNSPFLRVGKPKSENIVSTTAVSHPFYFVHVCTYMYCSYTVHCKYIQLNKSGLFVSNVAPH